ncbi:MAG: beta-lactamase protein [Paenibacillaceae bacterium]|jgi:ribonuclease J|nr:beta-lactamase protein [Paenibacillaceae bacterium]
MRHKVKLFALGGLDEIGKNMYGVEYRDEIVVIDAGIKFPDADLPGVDYIIPDIRYLLDHKEKVKGIFLTHGHEDHIGGLPFILRQLNVPIYGAALTLGLVRFKLEEHKLLRRAELHLADENSEFAFKHLSVKFFRTAHSIPDAFGIVVDTPQGQIVHTGDFKFDLTPLGQPANLFTMADIGRRGVLAMLADSTNSEKPGYTPSERVVGKAIRDTFRQCPGRILFATFASNVHRLQQVVEAAYDCGRKIAIVGRSMEKVFRIGQELGYIRMPKGMMVDVKKLDDLADEQVVVICTGSQGEPNAALTRIASGSHTHIQIYPGDTVIFSSSPIPGNSRNVHRSIDRLLRAGAEVIYGSIIDIHASGHGCQEDLKLMLNMMKPQYLMPIHGEHRMLLQHSRLAQAVGMDRERVFVMDNGDTLLVGSDGATKGKRIPNGQSLVKGNMLGGEAESVVTDRKMLSESGVVIVMLALEQPGCRLLSGPDLISRGFVYVKEAGEVMAAATRLARRQCARLNKRNITNVAVWKEAIGQALAAHFDSVMERSPLILPIIAEVEEGMEGTIGSMDSTNMTGLADEATSGGSSGSGEKRRSTRSRRRSKSSKTSQSAETEDSSEWVDREGSADRVNEADGAGEGNKPAEEAVSSVAELTSGGR